MTQQTINNEGAFDYGIRTKVNDNFTELYGDRTLIARQSADVTATTNETLANLTGLVQTVEVGTYKFKVSLQALSTINGGTKVAFKYTNTVLSSIRCEVKAFTASAVAVSRFTTTTDAASIVAATVANICIEIEGTFVVTTAGTIQVQGAQNASHSDTTTFYAGSSFEITKL